MLNLFNDQLARSVHLTDDQAAAAADQLVDESVPAGLKADFLCHLALKGETVQEISAFARALRDKAVQPPLDAAWRETHDILARTVDELKDQTFQVVHIEPVSAQDGSILYYDVTVHPSPLM